MFMSCKKKYLKVGYARVYTTNPEKKLIFHIFGVLSEFEL